MSVFSSCRRWKSWIGAREANTKKFLIHQYLLIYHVRYAPTKYIEIRAARARTNFAEWIPPAAATYCSDKIWMLVGNSLIASEGDFVKLEPAALLCIRHRRTRAHLSRRNAIHILNSRSGAACVYLGESTCVSPETSASGASFNNKTATTNDNEAAACATSEQFDLRSSATPGPVFMMLLQRKLHHESPCNNIWNDADKQRHLFAWMKKLSKKFIS